MKPLLASRRHVAESTADRRCSDFVALTRHRAVVHSAKTAYVWLDDDGAAVEHMSYAGLDRRARAIAARLQSGAAVGESLVGERVLLLFPPGLAFVEAFFGCLYAGVTAVPLCPLRRREPRARVAAIAADAGAKAILLPASSYESTRARFPLPLVATDESEDAMAEHWRATDVATSPAFLQYTSGSTGDPKGVVLSHGNLLHNSEMLKRGFDHSEGTVIVSWLPLFHDMGLIGQVLQSVYCGGTCVLMAPLSFVTRPIRWLEAISRFRATTSGGPNFAYDLCVKRVAEDDIRGVDLSSWRVAFNGAEPVRADTLRRFVRRFRAAGLRRESLYPCYGLAEATLFSTGGLTTERPVTLRVRAAALEQHRVEHAGDLEEDTRVLVGCGRTRLEQEVIAVDPDTGIPCAVDRVGEIWIHSGSVARGYWGKRALSHATFRATPFGSRRAFLRTGDLGFVQNGELFITGRLKDVIIIAGRNHYPHDIERTVGASHVDLRPDQGVAFSLREADEDRLIVVQEVERRAMRSIDIRAVTAAVRSAVQSVHDVRVHRAIFVRPGGVPRTSSGKVQRAACRTAFSRSELPVIEPPPPRRSLGRRYRLVILRGDGA